MTTEQADRSAGPSSADDGADAGSDPAPGAGGPTDAQDGGEPYYEGSGAWGTWALGLLLVLFVIAAGATVHSIVITFTG